MRRSLAQAVEHLPGARAEQADDDLAVGERGVVVGNLAQARRGRRPLRCRRRCGRAAAGLHGVQGAGRGRGDEEPSASYRSAAKRRPHGCASRCRGGYSRLPARAPARDKRGCHPRPATIAPSRVHRSLVHGVVMQLKLLVSCPLAALAALATPAQAQIEIQWWHAMGGAARRMGQRPRQGLQRQPEGLQGRRRPSRAATTNR